MIFSSAGGTDLSPSEFLEEEYYRSLGAEEDVFSETPDDAQRDYILSLVYGVREHRDGLDGKIAAHAIGWKLNRISKTALALLRLSVFEILYREDIPDSVSINEAVELAKDYDEPETVKFINGVLGSIVREKEGA